MNSNGCCLFIRRKGKIFKSHKLRTANILISENVFILLVRCLYFVHAKLMHVLCRLVTLAPLKRLYNIMWAIQQNITLKVLIKL